jgi:hypothetical protein
VHRDEVRATPMSREPLKGSAVGGDGVPGGGSGARAGRGLDHVSTEVQERTTHLLQSYFSDPCAEVGHPTQIAMALTGDVFVLDSAATKSIGGGGCLLRSSYDQRLLPRPDQ